MQLGLRHWGSSWETRTRGALRRGTREGRYLGFTVPSDPLKVARMMLVIWSGKGEGPVKTIGL